MLYDSNQNHFDRLNFSNSGIGTAHSLDLVRKLLHGWNLFAVKINIYKMETIPWSEDVDMRNILSASY